MDCPGPRGLGPVTASKQYSDAMLDGMQTAYGSGFLSPGGAEETRQMVEGLTVENAHVLDLGCGVGGAALLLAGELNAGHVTAVDVEAKQLERAWVLVEESGLADRITLKRIEPGTLPLPDNSFDIVLTKDVMCHFPDKTIGFQAALRVLKPGGTLALADWMRGKNTDIQIFDNWADQLAAAGLVFYFESVEAYMDQMRSSGFREVTACDHTQWSTQNTGQQLDNALGSDRDPSIDFLGGEGYDKRTLLTRTRYQGLHDGEIEHWHVRGDKTLKSWSTLTQGA